MGFTKKDKILVQAAEMRILRSIDAKTRRVRIRNTEIREQRGTRPLQEYIEQKRYHTMVCTC